MIEVKFFPLISMLVSSANIIHLRTFVVELKSFMYNRNKSGPRIEPCGTPHFIGK